MTAVVGVGAVQAADHRDGAISQDAPADIADTYAFVNPNDTTKVVIGVTVNPYVIPGVNASFSTDVLYQIKIDNDGDFKEDLVFQAIYQGFDPNQTLTLIGPSKPGKVGAVNKILKTKGKKAAPVFTGPSNGTVLDASGTIPGMRVFSGRTDDPFFIDLIYVRSLLGVIPPLAREPGIDLFSGLNVSSIMIEIPISALKGEGDVINVWSTASRTKKTVRSHKKDNNDSGTWIQIDREGLPAINAALVPGPLRNDFNRATPDRDAQFVAPVAGTIAGLGILDQTAATALTNVLLPDVIVLDTTSLDPFPNGRAPADDFIDVVLGLITDGAITTDGLDTNDSVGEGLNPETGFPTTFPFLAPPHTPDEIIPSRN